VEFRFPFHGGPRNSTRTGLLNHQTSKISINSNFDEKFLCRCLKFEGLKVELV
jgi:hypothetical protein